MDYRLEQWINGPAGQHATVDWIMRHISTWSEPAFIALIVVWFLIGWLKGLPRDRQGAITAAIAAGGALLVNLIIHSIWDRPRPFIAHPNTVHVLLSHVADASFPSDHASVGSPCSGRSRLPTLESTAATTIRATSSLARSSARRLRVCSPFGWPGSWLSCAAWPIASSSRCACR